jgi:hypothetical protein
MKQIKSSNALSYMSKLNVDGAWTDGESVGGTGMILRDDVGMISVSACWSIPSCSSPLEAG